MTEEKDENKNLDHQKVEFKNLTIESFVKDTILNPLQDIFKKTSKQFLRKYLMSETP